jgi:hypothetical protein
MSRKLFQPGNTGGGRPLGSRNKLQGDFLKALAADFARVEKPVEYLKLIASVLPKELVIEQNALSDLSDEEIAAHLTLLQKLQLSKSADQSQQT